MLDDISGRFDRGRRGGIIPSLGSRNSPQVTVTAIIRWKRCRTDKQLGTTLHRQITLRNHLFNTVGWLPTQFDKHLARLFVVLLSILDTLLTRRKIQSHRIRSPAEQEHRARMASLITGLDPGIDQ